MKFSSIISSGMLALALSVPAQAQPMLNGVNVPQILNVARGYGTATLTSQSNGDPQISGEIDGITYQVFFRNCTDNTDCEDLNFYLGFLDVKPAAEIINDWNLNKRFSRAYLDEEGDACVEMDLDLAEGVSVAYLNAQFGLWEMVVAQFSTHVGYE